MRDGIRTHALPPRSAYEGAIKALIVGDDAPGLLAVRGRCLRTVGTPWTELLGAGDEILDGARDEHLSGLRVRRDACAGVDGDAADLAVHELALTGVEAGAYIDAELAHALRDRTQRIARVGPSKLAKNPSPAVSSSWPRKRASSLRTRLWWPAISSDQRRSPSSAAFCVESTMSVKSTVVSLRSISTPSRISPTNALISARARFEQSRFSPKQ
jgi:hypothetical protein